VPGTPGHERVLALLTGELAIWTDVVGVQSWMQRIDHGPGAGRTLPMHNVFGLVRGRDDAGLPTSGIRPDLMLCAHWDTRPVADQDRDPARRMEPVPGANDGASGVAVLLEMARALHARRPPRSVLLAFWDGEDLGEYYYGSRLYAKVCRDAECAPWRPRRAVLVDMVAGHDVRCSTELNSIAFAPDLWTDVHRAAEDLRLRRHFDGPRVRVTDDHVFLHRAGIPSIVLIDYSYPHWHTTADTVDACSADSLQAIGDVLSRFIETDAETSRDSSATERAGAPGRWLARGYLLAARARNRVPVVPEPIFTGVCLGLLGRPTLHAVDELTYDERRRYHGDEYNLSGLFDWERSAIDRHFRGRRRLLVTGAGGGREVLALAAADLEVEVRGHECNAALVAVADGLIARRGLAGRASVQWLPRDAVPRDATPFDGAIVGWSAYMLVIGRANRVRFLAEVRDLLLGDSPLLLSFFTRDDPATRLARVVRSANVIRRLLGRPLAELGDDLAPNFVHRFTREEIEAELRDAGFRLAEFRAQGPGPFDSGFAVAFPLGARAE
jgi:hypothetical protein